MLTSYHVHSILSDGRSTIREQVETACEIGLDEIGMSDHYVLLGSGERVDWSMDLDYLPTYVAEVKALQDEMRGRVVVRLGLEADFDPESADELSDVLRAHPFDYVIGSVHYVDGFNIDECKDNWDVLTQPERNDVVRAYWDRVTGMAGSRLFDIVGHVDLYKKFGYLPTIDVQADISSALDAIAASGMAVELNTAGWYKDISEQYPSLAIIRGCADHTIPIVVTADAHHTSELTRGYEQAFRLLSGEGIVETVTYRKRNAIPAPLPQGPI